MACVGCSSLPDPAFMIGTLDTCAASIEEKSLGCLRMMRSAAVVCSIDEMVSGRDSPFTADEYALIP